MATAATVTDYLQPLQPLKRNSSFQFLPPNMSDLRVVLLGNSWSERRSVGNFILGQTVFDTEEEPVCCLKVSGHLKDKPIHLINTPDLLRISEDKLREHTERCASLSDPGPHVFLLVLKPENFTEEDKQRLFRFLQLYSDQSFDHSLVLISKPSEESSGSVDVQDQTLKEMLRMCQYRYLKLNILESPELVTRLGQVAKENNGEHVSCDLLKEQLAGLKMKQESVFEHNKPVLNLVLCGRRGVGKTSAAKAILSHTELNSVSNSSVCVKSQGVVCGHQLSVVELPSLYGKPQEAVMEESFKSVCLCDPQGIHAFVLVLPLDPLTDEDKGELKIIQDIFGCQVNDLTMILFTLESDPADSAAVDFINENRDIQDLCQSCGGRYGFLNIRGKQQISGVLDVVEKMKGAEGYQCYTKDMFTKAQMGKVVENMNARNAELLNAENSQMGDDESQSRESLRMVLVARTDSARNSTANVILGRQHFRSSEKSVTKRATGEIDGRPVVVVTTPTMFDTTLSDAQFRKAIKKCISMLSPGPHVFLLVLQIRKLTQEEKDSVQLIKKIWGKNSGDFIIVIVTGGEELGDQAVESYIKDCDDSVKQLINDCGGRYQVFSIKDDTNRKEVRELLMKIDTMVKKNGGCYHPEMFDDTEESIQTQVERILKQKEQERRIWEEELERKHKTELRKLNEKLKEQRGETEQERKLRTKQLKDKDECINKERKERKTEQEERERRWKKQEEFLRSEMKIKLAASEKIVQSEREQKEKVAKSLEQHKKEMKREREAWEKERKDLWEKIHQEDKKNLEEEKKRCQRIQDEYFYKRKKWTLCFCLVLLCLLLLLYHVLLR